MSEAAFRTVAATAEAELEEKRSVFLAVAKQVSEEAEAEAFVKERRRAHPDARHTVFAYLLKKGTARYSDDAEPQGTAGMPVLETIRRAGLSDVVVVVTRYFGGILLGAGGLTRAYAGAANLALAGAGVAEYVPFAEYEARCSYADHQKVTKELERAGARVRDTAFEADVSVRFGVRLEQGEALLRRLTDLTAGRAVIRKLGESMGLNG